MSKVFFSSVFKTGWNISTKILEQSWSKLSKLLLFSEKSSSKLFFLSYRKQFKQFGEHQLNFLNNWWAKIWGCNSFQERDRPKWNFVEVKNSLENINQIISIKAVVELESCSFSLKNYVQIDILCRKKSSIFLENINQKILSKFRAKLWKLNSSEKKRSSKVIFYQVENSLGNINQTISSKVQAKV